MRFYFVVACFMIATSVLIGALWCIEKLRLPGRRALGAWYFKLLSKLLRVRVHVDGAPLTDKPVLIVSNHVSWLDIPVIGSVMPLVFISKSEVRNWPLVGPAAQLLHTIFVDRTRRQKTAEVNARIASKMRGGDPVVLFAEGTSSDGNRVLQFRSALVGAASDVVTQNKGEVWLQPLSISYPRIDGLPMGRGHRPRVAWYGDMDFVPHLRDYLLHGGIDAVVTFGEPIAFGGGDRKSLVKSLETAVRRMRIAALRGDLAVGDLAVKAA
jgi:1-acyl-sn-glycerol-3-phosphate acyltransferase